MIEARAGESRVEKERETMRRMLPTIRRLGILASGLVVVVALMANVSCDEDGESGSDVNLDISNCDPANGPFSLVIDNYYLPFVVGAFHVLEGQEAGEHFTRIELEVPDETKEVAGVVTRVVKKKSWDDGELVGDEELYYAQAPDGTVCNFGEAEDVYEGGVVVETDGWIAREDGAMAVIAMPSAPAVGQIFDKYHDDEEVELAEVTHVGETTETPAGTLEDTITVLEEGSSIKKYARDIGEIYDDGIELIEY